MKKIWKAVLILGATTCTLTACGGSTVNLNDYLTVRYEGYDTMGTAEYTIDYSGIVSDYAKKIKFTGQESYMTQEQILAERIKGSLDKREYLSNGDEITFKWKVYDEEVKSKLGLKVKYSDVKQKVKDLEKIQEIDGFEGVKVVFKGMSMEGEARLDCEKAPLPSGSYELDMKEGLKNGALKNGDSVLVTIDENRMEEFCKKEGKMPKEQSKEYKVEGLEEYVSRIEDIDATLMEAMKKQTEDGMRASTATWENPDRYQGTEYLGSYILSSKTNGKNSVFLLYQSTLTLADGSPFQWVWYTEFENVVKKPDGSCTADVADGQGPRAFKSFFTGLDGEWVKFVDTDGEKYGVQGFATVKDFENEYIISKLDSCTYVTDVQ